MPYNLYTSAAKLWGTGRGAPPQQPQFDFLGSADDITAGGVGGRAADVKFEPGDPPVHYGYDATIRSYLRYNGTEPHLSQSGVQLAFRNVVIEMVDVSSGTYKDHAGNITHDINLIGSGRAILLRGGKAFEGTWSRASRTESTKLTDASGQSLRLAPGRTIIELVPAGQPVAYS
jgi:hypothetical protein